MITVNNQGKKGAKKQNEKSLKNGNQNMLQIK